MVKGKARVRVRRTDSEWRRLIAEQVDSGLTQREFCTRQGVGLATFGKAKRRVSAEVSPRARTAQHFIPVDVAPESTKRWELEVELSQGVIIRMRGV